MKTYTPVLTPTGYELRENNPSPRKVYVLVLSCGYEGERTLLRGHVSKDAATEDKLRELVRLEEIVRKHISCEKRCDDWIIENPPPGLGVCKCGPKEPCSACSAYDVVYTAMRDAIHREEGYDPNTYPAYAQEGFSITVDEIEVISCPE
jgi:hypothetical protein